MKTISVELPERTIRRLKEELNDAQAFIKQQQRDHADEMESRAVTYIYEMGVKDMAIKELQELIQTQQRRLATADKALEVCQDLNQTLRENEELLRARLSLHPMADEINGAALYDKDDE